MLKINSYIKLKFVLEKGILLSIEIIILQSLIRITLFQHNVCVFCALNRNVDRQTVMQVSVLLEHHIVMDWLGKPVLGECYAVIKLVGS